LCEQLAHRGFSVELAALTPQADQPLSATLSRPETIILDVSQDSTLGWEALKALKANPVLLGVPVVFYKSAQPADSLLELEYLTKPIELSELTQALDQHWLTTDSNKPTRTILVVDDEPNTLEMHARIVQTHSAANQILTAPNGREALAVLQRESVDLVLLDLQMPEMDGFEVLEAMRTRPTMRDIPVIVVTGKVLTEADMARLNQGVAAVLGKGLFSIEETVTHISTALERKRRLSREAQRLVRQAMAYLHSHFAESISRRELAQHVGITEDHLTFCFRQELGTTPVEYLQRYRIHQAKQLLKASGHTVTEIALSVGFSDSGYFSRIFRREVGVSPEAFRKQ
jgi:AraC-like DNA-binding protein